MRRVGSLDSYLLSTNHWPGQHKGGVLLQCYKRKHLKIVIPLYISSNANSYFEIILTSLFPALYAWASAFNRHFLEMMPTVVIIMYVVIKMIIVVMLLGVGGSP